MDREHPIQGLMKTSMETLRDMIDVNTVIGDPVDTPDGSVIIPVSRVTFGFAAGGTEFSDGGGGEVSQGTVKSTDGTELPFGGGSGAGVAVQPVGFLVVGQGTVRLLSVEGGALLDRLIDIAPQVISHIESALGAPAREKLSFGRREYRENKAGEGASERMGDRDRRRSGSERDRSRGQE
jgi:sporulation protein YtfJ